MAFNPFQKHKNKKEKNLCGKKDSDVNCQPQVPESYATDMTMSAQNRTKIVDEQPKSDMTNDLIHLMVQAIDQWAVRYHMENLPKDVVFEQALTIMNAFYKAMKPK
jgi:hypothetical protein